MSISQRQSTERAITLLAAQRQMYTSAKRLRRARGLPTIGLALVAPIVVIWWPQASVALGAVASAWLLLSRFLLIPWERRRREHAVLVQTEFDTLVLDLPRSPGGTRPDEKRVAAAARAHFKRHEAERRQALERWFPEEASRLARPFDALECQIETLAWSRDLHTEWAWIAGVSAAAWGLVGVGVAIQQGLTLAGYLIGIFLPSVSAFLDVSDRVQAHLDCYRRTDSALSDAVVMWEHGMGQRSLDIASCLTTEAALVNIRRIDADVPDLYYKLRRDSFEQSMKDAAAARVAEAAAVGLT